MQQATVDAMCAYCHTSLGTDPAPRCPLCAAAHHEDCWDENVGCAVLGCAAGPDFEDQQSAEDFAAQADPAADTSGLLARYPRAAVANFDGDPRVTELDALIAYLQMLGTLVEFPAAKAEVGSTATATAAAQ